MDCHNTPSAIMSASDIITVQLEAFSPKQGKSLGSAVKLVYQFMSLGTKAKFSSYRQFYDHFIKSYEPLISHSEWGLMDPGVRPQRTKDRYTRDVYLVTGTTIYIYRFKLSRQDQPVYDHYSNKCLNRYWRTDSIRLRHSYPVEFFDSDVGSNVYHQPLQLCSLDPKTGFYRDGYCNTGQNDHGTHTVCAQVTDQFLSFTKDKGNDLSSASPDGSFPGLKDGDHWCLCANRYLEAVNNGIHMKVNKNASHKKTLDYLRLDQLTG
jgi:uncharacterized protein (DUF2237 family)